MIGPEDVLSFWLDEIGPKGWYDGGDALALARAMKKNAREEIQKSVPTF